MRGAGSFLVYVSRHACRASYIFCLLEKLTIRYVPVAVAQRGCLDYVITCASVRLGPDCRAPGPFLFFKSDNLGSGNSRKAEEAEIFAPALARFRLPNLGR
jgi:hypothetical protein